MMKIVNSTTLLRPQSPDVQEGDNVFRSFLRIRLRIAAPAQRITPPTSGRNWPCVRVRTRTRMCVYVCVRARTYGIKKHWSVNTRMCWMGICAKRAQPHLMRVSIGYR